MAGLGWRWLALLFVLCALPALFLALPEERGDRLAGVQRWSYQLQNIGADLDKLAGSDSDMLVVDYAKSGGNGMVPLSKAEVERLKTRPDGRRRLVIAYFSIGEAEEYRHYWQDSWRTSPPSWLLAENCRWPRNHLVAFWNEGWRRIVYDSPGSYLARIQDAGFDGIYLDRIDVYADIASRHPEARDRMIDFVGDLARTARSRNPDFLVIAQNAEDLLDNSGYRRIIDAIAKEDLLYGVGGTGVPNPTEMVAGSRRAIERLRALGKPAFVVEYLSRESDITAARREFEKAGYRPVFPPRALDGRTESTGASAAPAAAPAKPDASSDDGPKYGTPEYAALHCDGVWRKARPGDAATPRQSGMP